MGGTAVASAQHPWAQAVAAGFVPSPVYEMRAAGGHLLAAIQIVYNTRNVQVRRRLSAAMQGQRTTTGPAMPASRTPGPAFLQLLFSSLQLRVAAEVSGGGP